MQTYSVAIGTRITISDLDGGNEHEVELVDPADQGSLTFSNGSVLINPIEGRSGDEFLFIDRDEDMLVSVPAEHVFDWMNGRRS